MKFGNVDAPVITGHLQYCRLKINFNYALYVCMYIYVHKFFADYKTDSCRWRLSHENNMINAEIGSNVNIIDEGYSNLYFSQSNIINSYQKCQNRQK